METGEEGSLNSKPSVKERRCTHPVKYSLLQIRMRKGVVLSDTG